jgi:hypothetical protein
VWYNALGEMQKLMWCCFVGLIAQEKDVEGFSSLSIFRSRPVIIGGFTTDSKREVV